MSTNDRPDGSADDPTSAVQAALDDIQRALAAITSLVGELAAKPDVTPRFLTVKAAATYTGLGEASVRRLLAMDKLTALRPVRGRIVVDRHELDSYVLSSTIRIRCGRGMRR